MRTTVVTICMLVILPAVPILEGSVTPSLDVIPKDNNGKNFIWVQSNRNTIDYLNWYDNIMKFLDKYYYTSAENNWKYLKTCSYTEWPVQDEVCEVDVHDWGDCSKDQFFNYYRGSPCIFLMLNKIEGWTPEYYDDPNELPSDMPQELTYHINITRHYQRKTVWVSCEGETAADKENLGSIYFYPTVQGFPGYYFPFNNSKHYMSPLVAVRFFRPYRGIVINVECRAWAKNIKYNKAYRVGSVHFELLID